MAPSGQQRDDPYYRGTKVGINFEFANRGHKIYAIFRTLPPPARQTPEKRTPGKTRAHGLKQAKTNGAGHKAATAPKKNQRYKKRSASDRTGTALASNSPERISSGIVVRTKSATSAVPETPVRVICEPPAWNETR